MRKSLNFPQDLLLFIYLVFFKPATLQKLFESAGFYSGSAVRLFFKNYPSKPESRNITLLAFVYIFIFPCFLGMSLMWFFTARGLPVNWLELTLYLALGIVMSLSFSPTFCIAFLLPFGPMAAIVSSLGLSMISGAAFSFFLGQAYGLLRKSSAWGLVAGLTYGLALGLLAAPIVGFLIGLAFLAGYFRLPIYLAEVLISLIMEKGTTHHTTSCLRSWNPHKCDELIWFPLPGMNTHTNHTPFHPD